MLDLQGEVAEIWDEILEAVQRVLRSGQFVLGPEVAALESDLARYLGVAHAVGVNSGTDALLIGLRAMGVGPGDEIVTTPFTFYATVEAIVLAGATPVFVDIAPDGFNLDPSRIPDAITDRTKAILPVHLFGEPAPMTSISDIAREFGLRVLEDCAQSFGATMTMADGASTPGTVPSSFKTGAMGDAAAFSFYPTKNLGAYGDGGLITTGDSEIADRARSLRNHAARSGHRYEHVSVGYNSRLDALQAAILRVKLPHVERWNRMRREAADRYDRLLAGTRGVVTPARHAGHVYHQYTIRVPAPDRARLLDDLADAGIASSVFYPPITAAWPDGIGRGAESCSHAATRAGEVVSLPMHPRISLEEQERVAGVVRGALT